VRVVAFRTLVGGEEVSEFKDGLYARHRFAL
jgi:hypothetical protein